MKWKMFFKLGLTVIIFVAVYMYYAINNLDSTDIIGTKEESFEVNVKKTVEIDETEKSKRKNDEIDDLKVKDNAKEPEDKQRDAEPEMPKQTVETRKSRHWREGLHLSVVCCGDRVAETVVMFKSAVLFTKSLLVFHIFADTDLQKELQEQLDFWPPKFREKVEYHIYNITFPPSEDGKMDKWRTIFKPCAAQRLFIPDLLKEVTSLLYVDTDIIFLSPIDEIWSFFSKFNSTQLAAVTPEHEDRAIGWYNRFARHPYYGELGVNSGVMMMNLTRLRASSWLQSMKNYYKEYRHKIPFGDQDLINIYFHFNPDQLYILSCEWNYRPDHCMYMSVCKPVQETGVYLLHGCRRVWHEDKQPAFKAVYRAFKEHDMGATIKYDLLESINRHMLAANASNCGKLAPIFTKQIQIFIDGRKPDKS